MSKNFSGNTLICAETYFFNDNQPILRHQLSGDKQRKQSDHPYCSSPTDSVNSSGNNNLRKYSCEPIDFRVKFKTEICKYWKNTGHCHFSDSCAFAHGYHEVREKTHLPNNYRTKKCKNFHEIGFCLYGERCQFLHTVHKKPNNFAKLNLSFSSTSSKYANVLENISEHWNEQTGSLSPSHSIQRLKTFELLTSGYEDFEEALSEYYTNKSVSDTSSDI
ncbi:zinc finger C-x8-C-x5-C-x3-H type protein (macronuclear) [Tetrahymena thermophila SB210]|uniref:Zinc finger C-x8-C-x5-C-x3-H type protein n=1 Tax=Tetrahymena thermophila (strain SB210) TaxID=312017 RepID=Q23CY7_TETTS|nr:zinc finger C-x8-C-x5-C-x3-H type protein [Tetrahymena thermophila SB210]EAR94717.3 zinc finger C-x8-C-x5-C-x3-H type protein [Tetrahymena thermophila SB210]|eukprot:XP_001014899.3 zinc finger C-x8-C-x5-C-x3-H type protein [Tetrahymena thermophila SB210]